MITLRVRLSTDDRKDGMMFGVLETKQKVARMRRSLTFWDEDSALNLKFEMPIDAMHASQSYHCW